MELRTYMAAELPQMKKLYKDAFPLSERKPFSLIMKKQQNGDMEMLSIMEDGVFFGLMITAVFADLVLLDYFAVSEQARGGGVGSKALALLRRRYAGKRLVLEIESPDPKAKNNTERVRRKAFYERNGFVPNGVLVRLFGVDMELLTDPADRVPYNDYLALYEAVFGRGIRTVLSRR